MEMPNFKQWAKHITINDQVGRSYSLIELIEIGLRQSFDQGRVLGYREGHDQGFIKGQDAKFVLSNFVGSINEQKLKGEK